MQKVRRKSRTFGVHYIDLGPKEKVSVTGVPETMIQTLYARAKESEKDNPMIQDDMAAECQTAHCGRYIPHFDFGAKPSPIVPYRHLPQSLSGMTADCRSLV